MKKFALCCAALVLVSSSPAAVVSAAEPAPIRIGILVPVDGPDKDLGDVIVRGVQHAIREWTHEHPSSSLRDIETPVIPAQLKWGAQTDALVDAVFKGRMPVIIGAADRKTAHLAAQVITRLKGETLLISLSEDPTLTQIGVPWILRFPPVSSEAAGTTTHTGESRGHSLASSPDVERIAPGALESAAHDVTQAVLSAMSKCGTDIGEIRSFLSAGTFTSSNGRFRFDAKGNRATAE